MGSVLSYLGYCPYKLTVKLVWVLVVQYCASNQWWCQTEIRTTTSFGYCSSAASLPVRPHCANARQIRCQADLNSCSPPRRIARDHHDASILRGWRLPSRTWNHWTSSWTKQLTWLRIVHSGDWCLRAHSGACQKWMNEWIGPCAANGGTMFDVVVRQLATLSHGLVKPSFLEKFSGFIGF